MNDTGNNEGDFPEVPEEILRAINTGELAVFIGASVSRIAGLGGWEYLAEELFKKAKVYGCFTDEDERSIFIVGENGSRRSQLDNKALITASYEALRRQGKATEFFELLNSYLTLEGTVTSDGDRIFKFLQNASALTLTTNADCLLHPYYSEEHTRWKVEDALQWSMNRNQLIHLHGCMLDTGSLVFTVDQYLKRYNDPGFIDYISKVFTEKTVLFIGYGLNEFELLDYVLTKGGNSKSHYVLASYGGGARWICESNGLLLFPSRHRSDFLCQKPSCGLWYIG